VVTRSLWNLRSHPNSNTVRCLGTFVYDSELALQIAEQFLALGASVSLKLTTILGGRAQLPQAISLSQRPHIVVATPGRLADLIMSSSGDDLIGGFKHCKFLVLDEADRLLEPSFSDDLSACMDVLPKASEGRQTLLFTATISESIREISARPPRSGQKPIFVTEVNAETYALLKFSIDVVWLFLCH
jgi:ATP-dependent RNA helicase DDX49/DBP8